MRTRTAGLAVRPGLPVRQMPGETPSPLTIATDGGCILVAYKGVGRKEHDLRGRQEGELVMRSSGTGEGASPEAEGRRLGGGAIASLIGVGLLLIFMIQNTESVQLDFLVWSFTWPLWLLTMASAVLGALVWFGVGVMRRHRRRKERRQDRRH